MHSWLLLPLLVALSWILTAVLRKYALSHGVFDVPNNRSSHVEPTPRGGGLAIVITFLFGIAVLTAQEAMTYSFAAALAGGGALVSWVGFLDDHRPVLARWRLLTHFLAAAWALVWLGGAPPVALFNVSVDLGLLGHVLAAFYLVWLLNLYNFMDGIDGIAGIEAVTVCSGAAALDLWFAPFDHAWVQTAVLAASTLGFLVWNWLPAKIFLGDAGSGFLGLTLGVMTIQAAWSGPNKFFGWLILLSVFVVDATATLLHRLYRREKVYEAHRSHAYQRAARALNGHRPVTLAVGIINVFWLLPIAFAVQANWISGGAGLLLAYIPLVLIAVWLKAGSPTG
jgi:Fuc2NAc and GlcNAc transferase